MGALLSLRKRLGKDHAKASRGNLSNDNTPPCCRNHDGKKTPSTDTQILVLVRRANTDRGSQLGRRRSMD